MYREQIFYHVVSTNSSASTMHIVFTATHISENFRIAMPGSWGFKILVLNQVVPATHRAAIFWNASRRSRVSAFWSEWCLWRHEAMQWYAQRDGGRWLRLGISLASATASKMSHVGWRGTEISVCLRLLKPSWARIFHGISAHPLSVFFFLFSIFLHHFCSLRYMYENNRAHFAVLSACSFGNGSCTEISIAE